MAPTNPGRADRLDATPAGTRVAGRYELLHEIAAGGMASVYLGRARGAAGFQRIVAIKVCHPHLRRDEEFSAMFLDEARLAAQIHHPNVVGTLDVGEAGSLFLVMDFIDGERLGSVIRAASQRTRRVPPGVAIHVMVEALSGLHAAHELVDGEGHPLHIVHRDVSPQNILVGVDGVTRIVDFGIAKAAARATVTRDGQVKGKLGYMPPEQITSAPVDRRTDVYAAGVVMWETLTGRRLFAGDNDVAIIHRVLNESVAAPSSLAPEVPVTLDEVVLRALARDPDARYPTALAFAEALEGVGVPEASTRAVAAFVREVCEVSIAARRTLLRSLGGAQTGTAVVPSVAHEAIAAEDVSSLRARAASGRRSDAPTVVEPSTTNRVEPPRRIATAAIVLALMAAALITGFALAHRHPPAPVAIAPVNVVARPQVVPAISPAVTPAIQPTAPRIVPAPVVPPAAVHPSVRHRPRRPVAQPGDPRPVPTSDPDGYRPQAI